jgi:folate-dependent phosphoribosylglycinamide formyltransferase PurN
MRVVILCSSPYSETGSAVAARLAQLGHVPVGALTLPSWDRRTLLRKVGQWGLRESYNFAVGKLGPRKSTGTQIRNLYLETMLRHGNGKFRSLREVARSYGFPVATCVDQNSPGALAQLKKWSADLAIFTGGNILLEETLKAFRIGVLNSHLALLPEIRGMSSPEWSLLCGVPLGITIHLMDTGIDTGPIVLRREFTVPGGCGSLVDLRNWMIATGIELIAEAVSSFAGSTVLPAPQTNHEPTSCESDSQFFVMHQRLKAVAERRLRRGHLTAVEAGFQKSDAYDG